MADNYGRDILVLVSPPSLLELELMSEDQLAQFLIAVYLASNAFLEMVREILQF